MQKDSFYSDKKIYTKYVSVSALYDVIHSELGLKTIDSEFDSNWMHYASNLVSNKTQIS